MGKYRRLFSLPVSSMVIPLLRTPGFFDLDLPQCVVDGKSSLKTQLRFGFILMMNLLAVAGLMFSHSTALLSGDDVCAGAGQDHHVDWHLLITRRCMKGVSAVPDCCLQTRYFSMAGMIFLWSPPSCWRVVSGTGSTPASAGHAAIFHPDLRL